MQRESNVTFHTSGSGTQGGRRRGKQLESKYMQNKKALSFKSICGLCVINLLRKPLKERVRCLKKRHGENWKYSRGESSSQSATARCRCLYASRNDATTADSKALCAFLFCVDIVHPHWGSQITS